MFLKKFSSKHSIWLIIIMMIILALITGWQSHQRLDRIDKELKNVRQYEKH